MCLMTWKRFHLHRCHTRRLVHLYGRTLGLGMILAIVAKIIMIRAMMAWSCSIRVPRWMRVWYRRVSLRRWWAAWFFETINLNTSLTGVRFQLRLVSCPWETFTEKIRSCVYRKIQQVIPFCPSIKRDTLWNATANNARSSWSNSSSLKGSASPFHLFLNVLIDLLNNVPEFLYEMTGNISRFLVELCRIGITNSLINPV